jgi:hypothetical protein
MAPLVRKFALTAHVTASVGWLGAVGGSLALSIAGLASRDPQLVRAAYLMLKVIGEFVLVPLAFASLLTGLVGSLGTQWGLFRHYWVLAKLVMNLFAVIVLLLYMQTIGYLAGAAAKITSSSRGLLELRNPSPVVHAGAALALLLVATTLSVYKPRGIRYGLRKQHEQRSVSRAAAVATPTASQAGEVVP